MTVPIRSGFVHSDTTSKGFAKQAARGTILPPFRIIDDMTAIVSRLHQALLAEIQKRIVMQSIGTGLHVKDAKPKGFSAAFIRDIMEIDVLDQPWFKPKLRQQFLAGQEQFFKEFLEDASDKVVIHVLEAIDRDDAFLSRLDRLQKLYIDNAVKRISGEQDILKLKFLEQFTDWVMGGENKPDSFAQIMQAMSTTAVNQSRFFARDQFCKFNRALTVSSYEEAGAPYVKILCVGDARTRGKPGGLYPHAKSNHWQFHNTIHPIDNLPKELDDYLCRCALIPVFKKPEGSNANS